MNHIRVTGCGEYILTKPKNNIYDQFWAQNCGRQIQMYKKT